MKPTVKYIIDIAYWGWVVVTGMFLLYWAIQVTTACSFHTPTSSMTPTLIPDDNGLVNKWKLGARIFDIFAAAEGRPYEIRRLPGYGELERGDVIIFNYPYLDSDKKRDSIAMNLLTYYCKRAVAVGGDTLEIRDCHYRVRGSDATLGVEEEQERLRHYVSDFAREHPDAAEWPSWMKCCPRDPEIGWTVSDMGPLLVPAKGSVIELTYRNWLIYRRYIEWETGNKLIWQDSVGTISGKPIKSYTFTENYCFAAGDHVIDSKDSRYIGLIPEKFIVGTAGILWKSPERNRIFSYINRR